MSDLQRLLVILIACGLVLAVGLGIAAQAGPAHFTDIAVPLFVAVWLALFVSQLLPWRSRRVDEAAARLAAEHPGDAVLVGFWPRRFWGPNWVRLFQPGWLRVSFDGLHLMQRDAGPVESFLPWTAVRRITVRRGFGAVRVNVRIGPLAWKSFAPRDWAAVVVALHRFAPTDTDVRVAPALARRVSRLSPR